MKSVGCYLFSLILVLTFDCAASQTKLVTLEDASKSAGLTAGSQQRLLKLGIDIKHLALGFAEEYQEKKDEARLEQARSSILTFPAPVKKNTKLGFFNKEALQQASFDLGILLAVEAQEQLKKIDMESFLSGFKTGYGKNISSPRLAAESIVVSNYIQQQRLKDADDNLKKSLFFLAENAKRKGVIVTRSGLQYEILEQGSGAKPTELDMVNVNYRHTKPNSDFMYDSAEQGHSETMALRGAIPAGWLELFLLMNKGSRYRVYLSPALGFGVEGNGDALLPNEVLITEFTLLDIIPPPPVAF